MKIAFNTGVPAAGNLMAKLRQLGFETCSLSDIAAADLVVLINPRVAELRAAKLMNKERRILVCLEPPSVLPYLYKRRVIEKFQRVFVQSPLYAKHPNQSVWQHGYFEADLEPIRRPSRQLSAAMVNANKTSFNPGSLYHLREVLALKITNSLDLNLYGRGWGQSLWASLLDAFKELLVTVLKQQTIPLVSQFSLRNKLRLRRLWLGEVFSACQAYSESHFALVVENDYGYFSEKIFNALQAGSLPIFVGQEPLADEELERCIFRLSGEVDLISTQKVTLREIAQRRANWKIYREQAFEFHNPDAGWLRLALQVQTSISSQEFA